jgi:hypothetical protein
LAGAFPVLPFPLPFSLPNPPSGVLHSENPKDGLRFISGCPDHHHVEALDPKKILLRAA